MTRPPIPDEVGRFILTSIPSVPYLEALLLLRRERERSWTAPELALRLYLPEAQTAALLASLHGAGIALPVHPGEETRYRYGPPDELAARLDQVAHHYASNLTGIANLIHSAVGRRAYDFANAFRWRKDS
jgi:hypothetical protein